MTEKTILLHIGTPKTGTSSIQQSLALTAANGGLGSVCYPVWRNDRNQQRLAMIYPPGAMWGTWVRQVFPGRPAEYRRTRERYRQFFFEELRFASSAVISAETLSSLAPGAVGQLRRDLEAVGYREFNIVLYVRDPADFYLSQTQQDLRGYPVPPFVKDPASFKYDFLQAADTWERFFPGKVIVRRFPADPRHDVVDDFAGVLKECFGITPLPARLRMNTTVSAEAMQILQDYRQTFWSHEGGLLTPDAANLLRFLSESTHEVPQTKPVLKQQVVEQIRAAHKADAEVLYARYGVDLGLSDCSPAATLLPVKPYRVGDILKTMDQDIVHQLLLRLARSELGRPIPKRSLPLRVAARAYRVIPAARRPTRLVARLRAL